MSLVKVEDYLGEHPDVTTLTAMFFFLNFLAATQDIAVDGWALTMLQRHNVGYASTCNSVGQTAGYFLGYVFFMGLESYGLVTLAGAFTGKPVAAEAAKKAGWEIGTPPPPKTYYPVVMYPSESDQIKTI